MGRAKTTALPDGLMFRTTLYWCLIASDPTKGEPATGARRPTVLIVDDEPDLRDSIQQFLQDTVRGIRVLTAANGRAGLATLETEAVDVILSDFKMPEMDGLEFLLAARSRAPRAARVLMTAFPDTELAIRAVNEGGVESFFTKPFLPAKVIEVVKSLLADRQKKQDASLEFARSLEALRKQANEDRASH